MMFVLTLSLIMGLVILLTMFTFRPFVLFVDRLLLYLDDDLWLFWLRWHWFDLWDHFTLKLLLDLLFEFWVIHETIHISLGFIHELLHLDKW